MVNLRVDDLEAFLAELKAKGIEILGTQFEDYGKFAWILDCVFCRRARSCRHPW